MPTLEEGFAPTAPAAPHPRRRLEDVVPSTSPDTPAVRTAPAAPTARQGMTTEPAIPAPTATRGLSIEQAIPDSTIPDFDTRPDMNNSQGVSMPAPRPVTLDPQAGAPAGPSAPPAMPHMSEPTDWTQELVTAPDIDPGRITHT